ncbi:hypothetical protein HaLaN_03396 [Haematococcus lacustris]|uniref:Uncharacterized protein n=1 Tax=Haematococcus lacustris TaxID=44745 RepID=A0A699YGU0_HAELA|nr:hypothetical protein HaLaN_03396 [Haematococcus lacustris]
MKKRSSKEAKSAQLNALNKSPRAGYLHCPNNIKAATCRAQATNRWVRSFMPALSSCPAPLWLWEGWVKVRPLYWLIHRPS